jgi:hypothetical protein
MLKEVVIDCCTCGARSQVIAATVERQAAWREAEPALAMALAASPAQGLR